MNSEMDDKERRLAVASALATEHFVLQTAMSTTVTEGGSRASIYIFALSSSLSGAGVFPRSRPKPSCPLSGLFCPLYFCSASSPFSDLSISPPKVCSSTLGLRASASSTALSPLTPKCILPPIVGAGPRRKPNRRCGLGR